jgi:hypothetical protein
MLNALAAGTLAVALLFCNGSRFQPCSNAARGQLVLKQDTSDKIADYAGFTFVLKECKLSGGELVCLLNITSNDEDKSITVADPVLMYDKSRMVDNNGNEYRLGGTTFGNQSDRATLVAGIPTRLIVRFRDVPNSATEVTLLRLLYSSSNRNESWFVQFRGFPITASPKPNKPSSTSVFRGDEIDVVPDVKKVSGNEWEIILPARLQQLDSADFSDPIFVKQGQAIIISASGRVNASGYDTPTDGSYKIVGPDGWYSNPPFNRGRRSPLPPGAPFMALAMRIGNGRLPVDDGRWVLVGSQKRVIATRSGYLHFTVNDMNDPAGTSDWWSNNEGALRIRVRIQ